MSQSHLSLSLPARPMSTHLDGLATLIRSNDTLAPRLRLETLSAIRTLARGLDHPASEIAADPAALVSRLKGVTPAMLGLKPARFANVISLVRRALALAGIASMPARSTTPLAPAWAALMGKLGSVHERHSLSRLARYASRHAIAPDRIDDALMARFLADITTGGIIRAPRKVHRTACMVWNEAVARIEGWPATTLLIPSGTSTYVVPPERFAPSFLADAEAWLARLVGRDPLEDLPFRPLKSVSLATRRRQGDELASAALHRGRDSATLRSLADLVEPATVKLGLRFILDRAQRNDEAPRRTTPHVHQLARLALSIATHWVKADAAQITALKALLRQLDPRQHGMTARNRTRLAQFDDPDLIDRLCHLPERLVARAGKAKVSDRRRALMVQTAVAIEILLIKPIRIRNLAELDIERHLLRTRKGTARLSIPADEVKNEVGAEAALPERSIKLIDAYLKEYRPLLAEGPSPFLFPGRFGGAKSVDALRGNITDCLKETLGIHMNPHLFRHFAARHYLTAHPGAYGVIRLLLGHKSVETTTRAYCDTDAVQAGILFHTHLLGPGATRPASRATRGKA